MGLLWETSTWGLHKTYYRMFRGRTKHEREAPGGARSQVAFVQTACLRTITEGIQCMGMCTHARIYLCLCVRVLVPAPGVWLWGLGVCVPWCKQLGSPEIQGKLQGRLSIKARYWSDLYCIYINIRIYFPQ